MLTSTFVFEGDLADCEAYEKAWNAWASDLRVAGFEPAEEPIRWSEDGKSTTYRLFELEHSRIEHKLDFGAFATVTGGAAAAVLALAGPWLAETLGTFTVVGA